MAHIYSKGWYIQQLKSAGISKHQQRKLETYKTYVLANLYRIHVEAKKAAP
ncbi:YflJ family protein [Ectobacillus ponti]|uniref:YflJ family protein n=1 Tax=Ectobacillus ponti TaxID=2961894 RepID=A0AA41X1I1_9BACI|nr:YflJ family protein [Ectobacillus ponti]MCP8967027.1 YflJ family protein [Ectobacillus ponti]